MELNVFFVNFVYNIVILLVSYFIFIKRIIIICTDFTDFSVADPPILICTNCNRDFSSK